MLRKLVIAAAALAASGCNELQSAVDMTPPDLRPPGPLIEPGYYCSVEGVGAKAIVKAGTDCGSIAWDGNHRAYIAEDVDNPGEPPHQRIANPDDKADTFSAIELEPGVLVLEMDEGKPPAPYVLFLVLAHGGAVMGVPVPSDDNLEKLLKGFPTLTIGRMPQPGLKRADQADDGKQTPYIAAGSREEIARLLKARAGMALREAKAKGEPMTVSVRERAGRKPHPPTPEQLADIAADRALAERLMKQPK